jgi:RNA 2',3'-cyclic 3'-phosphodiesterase
LVESVGRVFAAAPVPGPTRADLADRLSRLDIPGKVLPPEKWHITLRFLGRVDQVTYERFLHGMAPVTEVSRFPIRLGEVGAFPNPRNASVIWVGVERGGADLTGLAAVADGAATAAGVDPDDRPFRPHLSLSRVRPPVDATDLEGVRIDVGWICDRVTVYRSVHGPGGARYEPLETFELTR